MPDIAIRISRFDNAEAISMRAYWSAASAMTGRRPWPNSQKIFRRPGICR